MWYKNVCTTSFRFVINHAFDGQTDRLTDIFLVARPRCAKKTDNSGVCKKDHRTHWLSLTLTLTLTLHWPWYTPW